MLDVIRLSRFEKNVEMQPDLHSSTSQITVSDLRELASIVAVDDTDVLAWEP